ncbi:MAG: ATP-binding protein [Pseudomonadota bacterium]
MAGGEQVPLIIAAGASAMALASLLWALRVSDGARGAAKAYRARAKALEADLVEQKSVLAAHPGVVLVWQGDELSPVAGDLGTPKLYGSKIALGALLKYSDSGTDENTALAILEGIADLEARDASGKDTTLRAALKTLVEDGTQFSLTISGQERAFLEADGRTTGSRVIIWVTDSTIRHLETSSMLSRIEETRRMIASDPHSFVDMLDKAPFPAWRMSGGGKLVWANPAYLEAIEMASLPRAVERQVMLDSQAVEQAKRTITDAIEIDETHHIALGGERRAMRILTFPLSGGAGAMAFDVTAQEDARDELNRHVKAHDETLNHVADGVAIFGADRRLIFHNRAFGSMWDLEEGFLIDGPTHGQVLDRLRERRKLPAQEYYSEWRANELAHYLDIDGVEEDTWSLPDGRTLSLTRQRHPMGGLLLLFRDITNELDLKTRYNAMISTQSATLNSLHEAVAVFGADARLRLSNDAFQRLWKLDPALIKDEPDYGDVIRACIPLFHDTTVWDGIRGHITDPSAKARQITTGEMRRSDGSILTYLTHPLPDGNTLIAFADVTATRRVETALRERAEAFQDADRLKTEFVQNVSYQLRSPLTTILGYAEFLESQRHGALTERQSDYVNSILLASDHLSKLIENILDLAMIEAGRMDLDLAATDIEPLVRDCVDMVVSKAEDTEVTVKIEIADDVGQIHADAARLRQVLFNLLSNAIRFTEAGGTVSIAARRAGDMVTLTVADTGKGMGTERRAMSFDSFTSGDQRGAGLGLALVHRFVDLHGGNVGIKENPGGGTVVTCWLPVGAIDTETDDALLLTESHAA